MPAMGSRPLKAQKHMASSHTSVSAISNPKSSGLPLEQLASHRACHNTSMKNE